jgi:glutaredoxin
MKRHHTVMVYTNGNQFSNLVREFFRVQGVEFEEVIVNDDPILLEALHIKTGKNDMPVVEIDGRVISGYRPDLYEAILHQEDEDKKFS